MNIIKIKTQAELDALPDKFEVYTRIQIEGGSSDNRIIVKKDLGNSWVEAWENSSVLARENSSVVARGNSSVVARGNSSVVAWENSSVLAWEKSSVLACENSSVVARGNSSVEAWGNSSVEAWGNSSVLAWENSSVLACGNSSVVAYHFALISVLSATVVIKHLADYTVASLRGVEPKILKKDETAKVVKTPTIDGLKISFETWLERGYVRADGIFQKFVSKKKRGKIDVFTVENFPQKKQSYVVKKGEIFSHGETVEKAIEGLRYKLSDRDTSRFKKWVLTTKISEEDAIQAYRAITGACEYGVKSFVESIKIPKNLTVKKVIALTKDKYGSVEFQEFFNK